MHSLALAGGLLAALGWGTADYLVAAVAPRVGARRTFAATQPLGAALLLALVALGPWSLATVLSPGVLGVGVLGAAGYYSLYTALARGPASVASPVGATYGAVAALLAVAVGGERLSAPGYAGLVLLAVGVVLVATDPRDARAALRAGDGLAGTLAAASAAAVLLGATIYLLGGVVTHAGVVPAVAGIRVAGAVVTAPVLVRGGSPRGAWRELTAVAALDSGAFTAYGLAVTAGFVATVSPVAGLFAVVTVGLAVLCLGERLARLQWVGVACVVLGTPLLAGA